MPKCRNTDLGEVAGFGREPRVSICLKNQKKVMGSNWNCSVSNSQSYFANFCAVSWLWMCTSKKKTTYMIQPSRTPWHLEFPHLD